jgi:enoyl-[acyl-carrier-protein] reductase (NADH)
MEEQLNKTIQELKAAELKITKQEEEAKSNSTTVIYQTKPEKSLRKFRESDDVDDWLETMRSYISQLKKESEKVDIIMNFLDYTPYTEVGFRIDRSKATASEVKEVNWRVSRN